MGIYSSLYGYRSLQEVEKTVDGQVQDLSANDASSTTDYTADDDNTLETPDQNQDNPDTTNDTQQPDDTQDPNNPGDEEGTDYTDGADDALGDMGDDMGGGDDGLGGGDAGGGAPAAPESEAPANKSELQNLEAELFSDLTPEQINIKHRELKQQYIELYNNTEDIIDRINYIPKTEQNIAIIDFVVTKLADLREMINYYLTEVYATKTYTENTINYQQYLAVLAGINKILKEIPLEND